MGFVFCFFFGFSLNLYMGVDLTVRLEVRPPFISNIRILLRSEFQDSCHLFY